MYILGELSVGHVKACSANDRVDLVLSAILGHDVVRSHLANPISDDLDIGLGKRRIEVIGQQNALAAHCILRREFCPEHRIRYLLLQVPPSETNAALHNAWSVDKPER